MADHAYKEITILPENSERWKDVNINAGASQSTLQDIKLPETAGCFTYRRIKNRFIYWRTINDVLELVEVSLDINLRGNHLRLRFQHSPILQGVSIHETTDCVVILVPTVSTIHRFNFLYPKDKSSQGKDYFLKQSDIAYPSVFFDASVSKLSNRSSYFILNHASVGVPLPHTSCSWLTNDGDAAFVLANSAGSHLMVIMEWKNRDKILQLELKRTSVMSRLWNGLVRTSPGSDVSLGLVCHQEASDVYIFSLCRDLRIRMWSQNKQECLMMVSTLDHFGDSSASFITNSSAQHCWLRKSVNQSSDFLLGVYLSLPQFNQFLVFQPIYVNEQYRLSHVVTLMNSRDDLVDFCVSSYYVWGLWLNSENMPVVKVASIESNELSNGNIDWTPVNLEPSISSNIYVAFGALDYTEAYLKEIFKPGRFSTSTIAKVLFIYNKSIDSSAAITSHPEIETLREEVVKAVETEIFSREREGELTDEDLQQLKVECWDKFFSYCIQYHEVGTKPLGISFDPVAGYGIIIKKNVYSMLCPCDSLEQLKITHSDETCDILPNFSTGSFISEDTSVKPGVISILHCLNILKSFINEDLSNAFEHELFRLQTPDSIGKEIVKELIRLPNEADGSIFTKLQNQLQMIPDLVSAIKYLLRELDVSQKDEPYDLNNDSITGFGEYQHFLFSSAGLNLLCGGFNQFVKERFYFCRDLLLLELLITQLGETNQALLEIVNSIHSDLLPSTILLVNGYFVLKWMSECEFTNKPSSQVEAGIKQLSLHEISEETSFPKHKSDTSCRTLVYYYLEERGRKDAYTILSAQISFEEFREKPWTQFLPQFIANVGSLLWSAGPYFQFPEFLLNNGQCLQLQEYIRLLRDWCDWNSYSRHFLSANCFLVYGEYENAVNLFVKAADGTDKDDFLRNKILPQGNRIVETSPIALYYMKVIQLFEHYKLSHYVIKLATTVIDILDEHDSYLPIFWSLIFKHHLELGHSQEAYTALTHNPDPSRQKDCLRQMIVIMCERREFHDLVKFPYLEMQDDVVTILETRARASDLLHQKFYDLLYAFHMENNNFRKAASIMFECGMRLGQEVNNYEGLQKHASCLLAAINCLHLVDPRYAWIVKPIPKVLKSINGLENENTETATKRDSSGQKVPNLGIPKKKIEVLEICDIRREYDLIRARLLLVQRDQSSTNLATTPLGAADCVTLLIQAGFFDIAIELSISFSLPLNPIFEGLTDRCILTMLHPSNPWIKDEDKDIFDWLGQNDASNLPAMGYISAKEQAWYLLKHYLFQHEKDYQTKFHYCITSKLLSLCIHLPVWLKHSYQKRNYSELLWLYIKYGMLEEATILSISLIDAVLGRGKEEFGIKHELRATNPPIWLPHTYLDALCDALEDTPGESNCTELYNKLTTKLKEYLEIVNRISEDMLMVNISS